MIQAYLKTYYPPIPVLDILIAYPDSNKWQGKFLAIVDSGADFTIIPLAILRTVNSPIVRPAVLSSQWKDRRSVNIHEIDLQIGALVMLAVEVAGDLHSTEIILGRNVLNELNLYLDGPGLQIELAE